MVHATKFAWSNVQNSPEQQHPKAMFNNSLYGVYREVDKLRLAGGVRKGNTFFVRARDSACRQRDATPTTVC
jgi:hypothetical protein